MRPSSTNGMRRKKREALFSACFHSLVFLALAAVVLYARERFSMGGIWGLTARLFAILDLGATASIWILYKQRLKEIQGGEEDAAAQY